MRTYDSRVFQEITLQAFISLCRSNPLRQKPGDPVVAYLIVQHPRETGRRGLQRGDDQMVRIHFQ